MERWELYWHPHDVVPQCGVSQSQNKKNRAKNRERKPNITSTTPSHSSRRRRRLINWISAIRENPTTWSRLVSTDFTVIVLFYMHAHSHNCLHTHTYTYSSMSDYSVWVCAYACMHVRAWVYMLHEDHRYICTYVYVGIFTSVMMHQWKFNGSAHLRGIYYMRMYTYIEYICMYICG